MSLIRSYGEFYDTFTTEPSLILSKDEATGELWQGGTPDTIPTKPWDVVVGLEHHTTPNLYKRVRHEGIHIWHPIDDTVVPDDHAIRSISAFVADRVELGDRVLVHCSAGLNRSGVVSARAMMWLGYSAADAIAKLRQRRYPEALCNPNFVRWLYKEEELFNDEELAAEV
jgi:protein-tyrosine phosphatase